MILHVMMEPGARDALWKRGFLAGDRSRICFEGFESAYRWMADRMAERLPPPPDGVEKWPLWGWRRWRGLDAPDPCAEEYAGQDLWLVSFEARPEEALLSCFESWHYVLNGWYLPDLSAPDEGVGEGEAFEAELKAAGIDFWRDRPIPSPFMERVEASWHRIFDVRPQTPDVQAVFWRMEADRVVSERPAGRLAVRPAGRP